MAPFYLYSIGAGWNLALIALTNFESLSISGEPNLKVGGMYGTHDPGVMRIRGDGIVYMAGYPACALPFPGITRGQVRYLSTTFCNSGYSGKVTLYTRLDDPATYARYNAIMRLPKLSESQKRWTAFQDYIVRFDRLVAL